MLKRILKGLAISLGAGLVLRAGARDKGRHSPRLPKSALDVTPLMDRLDAVELRMSNIECAAPVAAPLVGFATTRETMRKTMQEMVQDLERRTSEQIASVGQRLDDLQNHLPRFIDVKVTARIREMEDRLKADILETRSKTLEAFIASVESKVLDGIAGVESSLSSQAHEIGDLRERLGQTDQNLSRILSTVDRLTGPGAFQLPRYEAIANGH